MKRLGPTFVDELRAAGLFGLLNWSGDGDLWFTLDATDAQRAAVAAVVEAHDPTRLPAPPVPSGVSAAQAKQALWQTAPKDPAYATLLAQVDALVGAHPYEPVRIFFNNANVWERSNAYVSGIGAEIPLSDAEMDDLFRLAAPL